MNIKDLVIKTDEYNRDQKQKYNVPFEFLYEISLEAGIRLAKYYNANEDIVKICIAMMDAKLP